SPVRSSDDHGWTWISLPAPSFQPGFPSMTPRAQYNSDRLARALEPARTGEGSKAYRDTPRGLPELGIEADRGQALQGLGEEGLLDRGRVGVAGAAQAGRRFVEVEVPRLGQERDPVRALELEAAPAVQSPLAVAVGRHRLGAKTQRADLQA